MGGGVMKTIVRKYGTALISLIFLTAFLIFWPQKSAQTISTLSYQLSTMLQIIPPIFILLGLFDVWVPREIIIRLMGPGSGFKGGLLGFVLGSAAAGPLYGAFPIVAVLMKKGASFTNILIFISAWSTTKIPMFLFELNALGYRFAVSRLIIDLAGILFIAALMNLLIPQREKDRLYAAAQNR